ncbi:MAG TPA: hypothetical protein VHP34_09045 [Alphaproteobacteria bacterium]|nr:hypothetical protein [Alphaproteobacteria bacterium]
MQSETQQTAKSISRLIERGGERLWRFADFEGFPSAAIAQTLSRLARAGKLQRLSKGIYYRSRQTPFGKSMANPAALQKLLPKGRAFPSGISAANLLGFTTQMPKQKEIATSAGSLPRKLVGADTIIHTRRPAHWDKLTDEEAAWLDFLRNTGKTSELSPEETANRTIILLKEKGRFERLLKIAISEPPRSRAILGALGDEMGKKPAMLAKLRDSLNPLSRYDFGQFAGLSTAHNWYAKKK